MYLRNKNRNKKGKLILLVGFDIIFKATYGNQKREIDEIIKRGYLPKEYESFQQEFFIVYDIETFQTKIDAQGTSSLVYEAVQYPVSIGCASNIPGFEERFFCRENSTPEAGYAMVREFLQFVANAHAKHVEMIPETIISAIERISEATKEKFSKERSKLKTFQKFLTNMLKTSLFGYNSGRYDVPGKIRSGFQFDKYF